MPGCCQVAAEMSLSVFIVNKNRIALNEQGYAVIAPRCILIFTNTAISACNAKTPLFAQGLGVDVQSYEMTTDYDP